jgi:hypothetical protein
MIQYLSAAFAERGYETLTPVQAAVTGPALRDADLLVFNKRRLLEPIGNIPPTEAEMNLYAALKT